MIVIKGVEMQQVTQEDELSLVDIWLAINRYKKFLFVTPLICAVVTYIYVAFFIPPNGKRLPLSKLDKLGLLGRLRELWRL